MRLILVRATQIAACLILAGSVVVALGCEKGGTATKDVPADTTKVGEPGGPDAGGDPQANTVPETGGELASPEEAMDLDKYPATAEVKAAVEYAVANAKPADPSKVEHSAGQLAALGRTGRCLLNPGTSLEGQTCNDAYTDTEINTWIGECLITLDTAYADGVLAQDPANPSGRVSDHLRAIKDEPAGADAMASAMAKVPQVLSIIDAVRKRMGGPVITTPEELGTPGEVERTDDAPAEDAPAEDKPADG